MKKFSDYIVFVDESGYPGLKAIDPEYPVFVLAFCIFEKNKYVDRTSSQLQKIKFKYWGHDEIILHEHDIRKPSGAYGILLNTDTRINFFKDLNHLVQKADFTLIAVAIDKIKMSEKYSSPENLYELALEFGLERVYHYLQKHQQSEFLTHVVVEKRGKKEDIELELAFRRICDGNNALRISMPFAIEMIPKSSNSTGLQLADLVARPIGIKILRPKQQNRAYDILEDKFRKNENGDFIGWGLKTFP